MSKDQAIGVLMLLGSIIALIVYGWALFLSEWWVIVLKLTGMLAVGAVLVILAWIGYTLATTPPPKPIEEIEKELEEELKKVEEEEKKEEEREESK